MTLIDVRDAILLRKTEPVKKADKAHFFLARQLGTST